MPFKTYDTKADYDNETDLDAEPAGYKHPRIVGIRVGYNRAVVMPNREKRAAKFISILNIQPSDKVMIAGAGFGWTVEAMEAQGIIDVIAVDTSVWINSDKGLTEEADINSAITAVGLDPTTGEGLVHKNRLFDGGNRSRASKGIIDEHLKNAGSRQRVKQALGNNEPDIIITERMIENLEDAEVTEYTDLLDLLSPSGVIAHFVLTPTNDPVRTDINIKTLADWRVLLPNHVIIESGTFRSLP